MYVKEEEEEGKRAVRGRGSGRARAKRSGRADDPPPSAEARERAGGSRERRSAATRSVLVEAARRLFAERGYAGVSTEEIVRQAAVTRGALYHHFRDKKDL